MTDTVGIVIVSHSKDIAKGTADMVRQMVGSEVKVAFCGGNPDGGLGTNVPPIIEAIDQVWSPKGVAILVDLGGAETNSEMAVEMLQPERRERVVVCNAPIVEGAVMAATEAAGGSSLDQVRAVAEEFRRREREQKRIDRGRDDVGEPERPSHNRQRATCARRGHACAAGGEADQARQEISGAYFHSRIRRG